MKPSWLTEDSLEHDLFSAVFLIWQNSIRGPFKYYVIIFLTFLGPPNHLFDDLQYCKLSKIVII